MERSEEQKEIDSFVARVERSIISSAKMPHDEKTLILVSPRFFKAFLLIFQQPPEPNQPLRTEINTITIRGYRDHWYRLVPVNWLADEQYEYWSNTANCVSVAP